MIRYALACDQDHAFESWFPSGDAFDDQVARGLVACPLCGSPRVAKRLMTPALATRGPVAAPAAPEPVPGPETARQLAVLSDRERELRAMLRAVREHVVAHAENVGPRFAEEARRIHFGETEQRSIYGEASPAEAEALAEEGIEFLPIPIVPDDRN
jgi:hypothetical protein